MSVNWFQFSIMILCNANVMFCWTELHYVPWKTNRLYVYL